MSKKATPASWKKGQSGNPNGPKRVILPEVQRIVDGNRNSLKLAIIQKVSPHVEEWIQRIIEQGIAEGDVLKFKMLLEMALGKLVLDQEEFPIDDEEKLFVLELRKRKKALAEKNDTETRPDSKEIDKPASE